LRSILWAAVAGLLALVASADEVKPSTTAKVYRGPDGEVVTILEVNGSRQALVKLEGIGGDWDGKTFLWNLDDRGESRDLYFEKGKPGRKKTERYTPLAYRAGEWILVTPDHPREVELTYSKKDSKKITPQSVIEGYKP
jgi:hypothetical protein